MKKKLLKIVTYETRRNQGNRDEMVSEFSLHTIWIILIFEPYQVLDIQKILKDFLNSLF